MRYVVLHFSHETVLANVVLKIYNQHKTTAVTRKKFLTKNASLQKHYNELEHVFLITNTPNSMQLPYFCTMFITNALSVEKKSKFLKIILNN